MDSETKTCPDCAEEVKAAARVCRFCGYRFTGDEQPGQEPVREQEPQSRSPLTASVSHSNTVSAGRVPASTAQGRETSQPSEPRDALCPGCGIPVEGQGEHCRGCGTVLAWVTPVSRDEWIAKHPELIKPDPGGPDDPERWTPVQAARWSGIALATAGGVAMVVSLFLPLAVAHGLHIENNSLIAQFNWRCFLLLLAAGSVFAGTIVTYKEHWPRVNPVLGGGLLGLIEAYAVGSDKGFRTLTNFAGEHVVAARGAAAYVAGIGGILAILGSLIWLSSKSKVAS
jgi:hypothetical protein